MTFQLSIPYFNDKISNENYSKVHFVLIEVVIFNTLCSDLK